MTIFSTNPPMIFAGAVVLLAGLAGCAPTTVPSAVAVGPVAPGAARIWFYRDYEPSVSLGLATVTLNGGVVGHAQPDGSAFYRDIAPGRYAVRSINSAIGLWSRRHGRVAARASRPMSRSPSLGLAGPAAATVTAGHRDTFHPGDHAAAGRGRRSSPVTRSPAADSGNQPRSRQTLAAWRSRGAVAGERPLARRPRRPPSSPPADIAWCGADLDLPEFRARR